MTDRVSPPVLFDLAAHPLRWRLMSELARSDRQVRELTERMGERQSLVSYHLGRLRAHRLVSMRRSSFDRRDAYYSLDLGRFQELLSDSGSSLHPGLAMEIREPGLELKKGRRVRVLFLCTGNSARSQMAEALLRHHGGESVEVFSAGSHPKPIPPELVKVMEELGVDVADATPKHFDRFSNQKFDYVVTLCDKVREVCPQFPAGPERIHWSMADPSVEGTNPDERLAAFRRTASDIETRVKFLLYLVAEDRRKRST